MIDQMIKEKFGTGWVKWEYVKVTLETPRSLSCEAAVVNLTENTPACLVIADLEGEGPQRVTLKFWLGPGKSELVKLSQELSGEFTRILDISVDEE